MSRGASLNPKSQIKVQQSEGPGGFRDVEGGEPEPKASGPDQGPAG